MSAVTVNPGATIQGGTAGRAQVAFSFAYIPPGSRIGAALDARVSLTSPGASASFSWIGGRGFNAFAGVVISGPSGSWLNVVERGVGLLPNPHSWTPYGALR
jgi:hypothetical protein